MFLRRLLKGNYFRFIKYTIASVFFCSLAVLLFSCATAHAQNSTITSISPSSGPASGGQKVTITGSGLKSRSLVNVDSTDYGRSRGQECESGYYSVDFIGGAYQIYSISARVTSYKPTPDDYDKIAIVHFYSAKGEEIGTVRFPADGNEHRVNLSSPLFAKSMGMTFADPYSSVCYEDVYVDDFSAYTYIDEVPTVSLGGSSLLNTQINNDGTTITGITTSHKPGMVNVAVTNTDGQNATLSNAYSYTYPNPSIASISPPSGYATGGDTVAITGTNLSMNDTVTINGAVATNTGSSDNTNLVITVPPNPAGTYDVVVTDQYGQSATLTQGFTYKFPPPIVNSIVPIAGPANGGQEVKITGSNLIRNYGFSKISYGPTSMSSCGIANGKVYCWGYNGHGQLGNNSTTDSSVPVTVYTAGVLSGKNITAVSTGYANALALASDGTVYGWGNNDYGQLGNNSTAQSNVPVAVYTGGVLAGKTITAISTGYYHSLALASDGTVYGWGYNADGELGNNSTNQSNIPVAVTASGVLTGKTIIAISVGYFHSLALASDGTVYGWGLDNQGQLGNDSTTSSFVPVAVYNGGVLISKTIIAISAGYYHSLALASDGTVYSWGYNIVGQLGNNATTSSFVPVAVYTGSVLSGKTITAISAGDFHSLALASDGTVYGWGHNYFGQLGNNSTNNSSVPVTVTTVGVLSGKTITAISAGYSHSLALASDGTAYGWGSNNGGLLGNNSTTQSDVPVAVAMSNLTEYPAISLGGSLLTNVSSSSDGTTITGTTTSHDPGTVDLAIKFPY